MVVSAFLQRRRNYAYLSICVDEVSHLGDAVGDVEQAVRRWAYGTGRHQCMTRAFLAKGTRLADLAVPVVVSAHVARLDLAICLYCGCGVAVVTGCDVGLI